MNAIDSGVPYIAPWASQFDRYATQIITMSGTGSAERTVTAPDNQWWRPIYFTTRIQTSSAPGARVMELQVVPPNGTDPYFQPANVDQGESVFCRYVFAPGVTAYSQTAVPDFSVSVQTIPDVIWFRGTTFKLVLNGDDSGDSWISTTAIAVQIYAQLSDTGTLEPVAAPLIG